MKLLIKNFLFVAIALMPFATHADEPATTCPTGYVAATTASAVLANDSCPSGYIDVATVTSCLVASPDGTCAMYVPADVLYTDSIGTYKYNNICPLE